LFVLFVMCNPHIIKTMDSFHELVCGTTLGRELPIVLHNVMSAYSARADLASDRAV
jgi:hypothetical protein